MRGLEAWETKTARRLTRALRRAGTVVSHMGVKYAIDSEVQIEMLKGAYIRVLERATRLGWLTEEMSHCPCQCHKPEPEGWRSVACCPDCGSTLWGKDENGRVVL